ncbi:MAG TPA: hypothetical protein VF893_05970 [Candidatus Bathyarchaeia archaeon]
MPSNPKSKLESPLVSLNEDAEMNKITITATPDNKKAKGKEEASTPLYLKRV